MRAEKTRVLDVDVRRRYFCTYGALLCYAKHNRRCRLESNNTLKKISKFVLGTEDGPYEGLGSSFLVKVSPLILASLGPVAFLVFFQAYRTVLANLEPSQQQYFTLLFGIVKVGFKQVAIKLVEVGNNPDMGPFNMFFYDAIAALSANIMFMILAESDSSSCNTSEDAKSERVQAVINLIMIDILENIYQAFQALFLVKKFQKIKLRIEKHQDNLRLERIEHRLNFTKVERWE